MTYRRTIDLSRALRDLSAERIQRPAVREEPLRGTAAASLTAWRGRSGRRYVCSIRDPQSWDGDPSAVVVPVRRDARGVAAICALDAAAELHVHRLAETETERAAARADLEPEPMSVAHVLAELATMAASGAVDLCAAVEAIVGTPEGEDPTEAAGALEAATFDALGLTPDAAAGFRRPDAALAVVRAAQARL